MREGEKMNRYYTTLYTPNNNKITVSANAENETEAIEKIKKDYPEERGYNGYYISK
jgi:hypothetical protein